MRWIFTEGTRGSLEMLSQVGVVLFMFLVGLELDLGRVVRLGKGVMMAGVGSMAGPFVLGIGVAVWMWGLGYGPAKGSELGFVLFMATALSITAFPVLARILMETGLRGTPLGMVAIACAAMNDVGGWCILAVVLALVKAGGNAEAVWREAGETVGLAVVYVGVMIFVLRPLVLRRVVADYERTGRMTGGMLAGMFILLTVSSLAADWIGIHAVFGAFMLGAVVPVGMGNRKAEGHAQRGPFPAEHGTRATSGEGAVASGVEGEDFVGEVTGKIEDVATLFLLPLFFAYTGLHTNLGLLADGRAWEMAGVITAVATVGKVGGTMLAARGTRLKRRENWALGVLMNTRGLMELIILNVGLEVGAIDGRMFSMMVVMTLATTVVTTPVVRALVGRALNR